MNARSTAAIAVAVMCAASFREARAQRVEPRAAMDFVTLGNGGTQCTGRLVFEQAIRGAPLCDELTTLRPTTLEHTFFLSERELGAKRRASEVALEREAARGDIKETRTETPPEDRVVERPEEVYEAVVTATPEPATLALVASGMAGLAAYRRRRAKKSEGINN
jgi:hypothetical protein